ncbi:ParB/Srx family N-terminal domain-containing protein [bacterium]|nr:ParB/Srx family N-terminal domain-containing protein [bacterium]
MTKSAAPPRLTPISVQLEELFLDPNNPRFVENFSGHFEHVPDSEVRARQSDIRKKMVVDSSKEADGHFDISDLVESMKTMGVVPIDCIVVRKLDGEDGYLVIEGNRRVSAAKHVLDADDKNISDERLDPEIRARIESLDVQLLKTEGLSESELARQIGVILGLRHFGAVKEWAPFAQSKNILEEYLRLPPQLDEFRFETARVKALSERLSISKQKVKKSLQTIIAMMQLRESLGHDAVRPNHYNLTSALVTNSKLRGSLIRIDDESFRLDEPSIDRMERYAQFKDREKPNFERLLPDEKMVRSLAAVFHATRSSNEALKSFAEGLVAEIEAGEVTVDTAHDRVRDKDRDLRWGERLSELLDRQEKLLEVNEFDGSFGNEAELLPKVAKSWRKTRLMLED